MAEDVEAAVEAFLDRADDAFAEYDQGYADADAVVRRLRADIDDLREAVESE